MAVFKTAYLTYQTFCLGLLRPFAVSFCLCATETTYSWDIPLPDGLLWVLHFFQFYLILSIFYSTKSKLFFYFYIFWNLIYILFWKFAACSFPISDWLKTPVISYFEKKSNMINHNAQKLSDFLKYIAWFVLYD